MSSNNPPAGQSDPTGQNNPNTGGTSQPAQLEKVSAKEGPSITKLPELLGEHNWGPWKDRIARTLRHCDVEEYAMGTIQRPTDPAQAKIWDYNDNYAQHLILTNISDTEMIYVGRLKTANAIWQGLVAIHETTAHQTTIAIIRNLFHTIAGDDTNITEHLTSLKTYWERINLLGDQDFQISDLFFKIIISSSLPLAWDAFTEPYVSGRKGDATRDPKRTMTSQQFIGILKEEYERRTARAQGADNNPAQTTNQAVQTRGNLASRIGGRPQNAPGPSQGQPANPNTSTGMLCRQCGLTNHVTENCRYLGARSSIQCDNCQKFRHYADKCWAREDKSKKRKRGGNSGGSGKSKGGGGGKKKAKAERANAATEESNVTIATANTKEELAFIVDQSDTTLSTVDQSDTTLSTVDQSDTTLSTVDQNEEPNFVVEEGGIKFDASKVGQYSGFKEYDPYSGNDYRLLWYDWVADSATTSHICNAREAFSEYTPATDVTVAGVGNAKMTIAGRGTVKVTSRCEGREHILRLENVLHIPSNRNNLLALGRWEQKGRTYTGRDGILTLHDAKGMAIAKGTRIQNNLYKMQFQPRDKIRTQFDTCETGTQITFSNTSNARDWETWHRRYGHVSYDGLRKLYKRGLVDGMIIDENSPQPDCVTCIEAKMTVEPYKSLDKRYLTPGELTHIDVWGKYDVQSINGHQYYLLFVDDATRFITVNFLKKKDEASSRVKQYLTHLKTQGKHPRAIRTDRGTEFVNEPLKSWCREQGYDIQLTAPYSPSQNGIAERMNRTLAELARAMINGQRLPEFLWEHAVEHAAYVRNRAYTRVLEGETPYQAWHGVKPNVTHLREFGAPVWVLIQGQTRPRKILSKSARRAYVGFEDGPKAVKYYNAETRKVLISRNFSFPTPPERDPSPEEVVVTPDMPREGELRGSAQPSSVKESESSKRKLNREEEISDLDSPRKTRGRRTDF